MKHGPIVFSFFIVEGGLLEFDSLLITGDLEQAVTFAEVMTRDHLERNGYPDDGSLGRRTDDGYALLIKAMEGVPAEEYQEVLWNYRMDGSEDVPGSLETLKKELFPDRA